MHGPQLICCCYSCGFPRHPALAAIGSNVVRVALETGEIVNWQPVSGYGLEPEPFYPRRIFTATGQARIGTGCPNFRECHAIAQIT